MLTCHHCGELRAAHTLLQHCDPLFGLDPPTCPSDSPWIALPSSSRRFVPPSHTSSQQLGVATEFRHSGKSPHAFIQSRSCHHLGLTAAPSRHGKLPSSKGLVPLPGPASSRPIRQPSTPWPGAAAVPRPSCANYRATNVAASCLRVSLAAGRLQTGLVFESASRRIAPLYQAGLAGVLKPLLWPVTSAMAASKAAAPIGRIRHQVAVLTTCMRHHSFLLGHHVFKPPLSGSLPPRTDLLRSVASFFIFHRLPSKPLLP